MNLSLNYIDDAHFGRNGDICFLNGQLLSVAEDNILKSFELKHKKLVLSS